MPENTSLETSDATVALAQWTELLAILHQEHEALLLNDPAAIERIVAVKQRRLAELSAVARELPESDSEERRSLARRCAEQNQVNGALIRLRRQYTQQLLGLLSGRDGSPSSYSAAGSAEHVAESSFVARV